MVQGRKFLNHFWFKKLAPLRVRPAALLCCYPTVILGTNWEALEKMPRTHTREVLVERFGNLKLPLGGKYEYKGVRGKQGRARDRFQGYTPKKTHFTELFDKPHEAAVALATLKCELALGHDPAQDRKPRKKRGRLFGMRNA
jgi:hypothetical protein